jgi:hypothetical protein
MYIYNIVRSLAYEKMARASPKRAQDAKIARGRQILLGQLALLPPSPQIRYVFGPKRYASVMGGLREHIAMFSDISHVIPTIKNVENYFIFTKAWPEWPQGALRYSFII